MLGPAAVEARPYDEENWFLRPPLSSEDITTDRKRREAWANVTSGLGTVIYDDDGTKSIEPKVYDHYTQEDNDPIPEGLQLFQESRKERVRAMVEGITRLMIGLNNESVNSNHHSVRRVLGQRNKMIDPLNSQVKYLQENAIADHVEQSSRGEGLTGDKPRARSTAA